MNRNAPLLALAMLWVSAGALAHPPDAAGRHDDGHHATDPTASRAWTNVRTGEVIRGAFLAVHSVNGLAQVSIERDNGDVVVIALSDLAEADRAEAQRRIEGVRLINAAVRTPRQTAADTQDAAAGTPPQAKPFNSFAPFVSTRWDERWLYIESDGLPHAPGGKSGTYTFSHPMMVGITAWQQQVPLPQNYTGGNAWRIPLKPELAEKPISAKRQLFRGAIALAVNGVPIFNPIKNDGRTDTFLAGELDEFGGHCGRADDYHYHIAPTHLQRFIVKSDPIAYALDGFPIYGLFDPLARQPDERSCPLGGIEALDELNGHFGATTKQPGPDGVSTIALPGLYHYHASSAYPYLNGGMRGVVTVRDDQIDPQPHASSPRAALPPLRGATITGFKAAGSNTEPSWSLKYTLAGKEHNVKYRLENGRWIFDFIDPAGVTNTEAYDASRPRRPQPPRDAGGRRPRADQDRPPAADSPREQPAPSAANAAASAFELSSADATAGRLSVDCTCDAKAAPRPPALEWTAPPEGTKAFAVIMHHVARDGDTHVYMVVADIPASVRKLNVGDANMGEWGRNTVNRTNTYAPPCSQGPGDKTYTITLYALSAKTNQDGRKLETLTRDALLSAMKDTTLATATLNVKYARAGRTGGTISDDGAKHRPGPR